jgi:hypothetical protein
MGWARTKACLACSAGGGWAAQACVSLYETRHELHSYDRATSKGILSLQAFNPIELWDSNQSVYGTIYLWALDSLSIPVMVTEYERTFSSAKKLITPERSALSDATIEASECLKAWWDQGLITRD